MTDLLAGFRTFERGFNTLHIPGLFYRVDNTTCEAGHARLFGKPLKGMSIYFYNRTAPGWALTQVWSLLGLVTLIHIERGDDLKRTSRTGWHWRFAHIKIEKVYHGFAIKFLAANNGYGA